MKILLFIRELSVGGAQRQLAELAAGLSRRGHEVSVLVLYRGGAVESQLADSGVRLLGLNKIGRWDLGSMVRLARLFRTERPEAIYSFLPTQNALTGLLAPRGSNTRIVFGIRSSDMSRAEPDLLSRWSYRLENWLSRRADAIVANSFAGRAQSIEQGISADHIAVVHNGIDTETMRPDHEAGRAFRAALGIAPDAFVVGCVARLDPMKDHETLLRAAAKLSVAMPRVHWLCLGAGAAAYTEPLKRLSASLGLGERLHWLGERSDLRAAYNAFDIATLSSAYGEGFSNTVCEAMACGVPVAATDVGDTAAIIGETGEIVPPRQPDLLSAAWSRLRDRLGDTPNLGARARQRIASNYSVEAMVGATEAVLIEVCSRRRP